jgi:ATP-dependent DNA helicase RecG
MSSIETYRLSDSEVRKLLACSEGHFLDLKSREIKPSKLSRTIAAFANAEGGELFVGIAEDKQRNLRFWDGFPNEEAANGHVQVFNELFPIGADSTVTYLFADSLPGVILKVEVPKSREIKRATDGKVYARRGAQNLPIETEDRLEILRRDKGLSSFETETVNTDPIAITNSEAIIAFMLEVVPTSEPELWLRK